MRPCGADLQRLLGRLANQDDGTLKDLQHYLLPDGNVQIAFSGGRTSAYMLRRLLDTNGPLPDRAVVTFQNTGREMPETLDFVREVGERWQVPIVWLEYRPTEPFFEIVGHNSASRNGEPFEALIRRRKYLPNQQTRFCSIELKVRTAKRYLRSLGWEHWTNCIGFRADEARRVNKPAPKDSWTVWAPLYHAGISKTDVAAFWAQQPFDLRLPNVKGKCWLGNCDGCFLKSEANIAALAREMPERAAWWEQMEILATDLTNSSSAAFFSKRYTRAAMRQMIEKQGDWIFNDEAYLCQVDDGECV